jgi:HNH endonuclease
MSSPIAFEYPTAPHVRRHGPMGYADYESYRDWLRDEFSFRCVFCLRREQWNIRLAAFHLDHFVPQVTNPGEACAYDNLLYVCGACNLKKSDLLVPDPSVVGFGDCLRVHLDGTIEALTPPGELLIDLLRLDDTDSTRYRRMMLEMLTTLRRHNPAAYEDWMGYPKHLPDLSRPRKKPPGGNSRPSGIAESCFARRVRGELPAVY